MRHNGSRPSRPLLTGSLFLTVFACLVLLGGCKDDKKTEEAPVEAKATQEVAPSGALAKLDAPESVIAFGGSDNPGAALGKLATMGGPMGMALGADLVAAKLAQALDLSDPKALDLAKPFRFAVIDPKADKEGFVLVFGTHGKDATAKALPANKKNDDGGNAFSYQRGSHTTYVNFLDDFMVSSPSKDLFGKNKAFLVKLVGAAVAGEGAVVVSAANATKMFDQEMVAAIQQLKAQSAAGSTPGMNAGAVAGMFDWMAELARDTDKVLVTLDVLGDGGKLTFQVHPKNDSGLSKSFSALKERKLGLLAKVPADAPAVFAMSIDPDGAGDLTRRLATLSLQISITDEAVLAKYRDAMDAYWKSTTGEMLFAAHYPPKADDHRLALSAIFGIRDAAAARKAQEAMRKMYEEESVKKSYAALGMKMQVKPAAYKIGDTPVDTIQMAFEAKPGQPDISKMPLVGDFFFMNTAFASDLGVIAYGKESKPTLEAWLAGKLQGGFAEAPGVVRAMKNVAPGMFMFLYVSPLELVNGLGGGGALPAGIGTSKTGIAMSAGTRDGDLHVVLDAPAEQVMALVAMFTSLGRGGAPGMPPGGVPGGMPGGMPAPGGLPGGLH
jgi:hypothetical protein